MYGQQSQLPPATKYFLDALNTGDVQLKNPDGGDTVFAQKMQQGIAQGLPQMQGMQGAKQDYAAAAPSVLKNMEQEKIQQMMQKAMQPKPAGIEGLQSNIRMAEGGVVGFAGDGEFGSYVPNMEAMALDELRSAEFQRKRQEEYQRQKAANATYRANIARQKQEEQQRAQVEFLEQSQAGGAAGEAAAALRRQMEPPQASYSNENRRVAAPAPQPAPGSQPRPQPRPQAASQAEPTGLAAALAQRPTYDTAGIAASGTPYIKAGEGDVRRIREAEGRRAELEKTLPDLSAKGIAALQQRMRDVETAETTRKENLGLDRVIQQLLGRAQGSGGAARADIQFMNAQRASEDAFSQARLGNQQAQLLLEKAQQERQLGREDRAIALEKEAATRMEKARDDALKAQQIAQSSEAAKFQGAVQMRGDDIRAQTAAADRAAQAALRNLPSVEQQMAERVMKDYMAKNPGSTLSDAWDFYRGARASSAADRNLLARQKLLAEDPLYKLARMQESQEKDPAKKAEAQRKVQEFERKAGIVDVPASAPTQIPSGVTVTKVGP
jgi:hypothetical protein